MSTEKSMYVSIKNWAEDDRPREKFLLKGQEALSNAELIAILIQNGTREKSALDLAKDILNLANNDLAALARLTRKDFQKVKGIGNAKSITLLAAIELGRRKQLSDAMEKPKISSSQDAATILIPLLGDKTHEIFYVLYLNNANKLLHYEAISSGGITATIVDIKMILKNALQLLASVIIVAHNHPSGNLKPSTNDKAITLKLKKATEMLDITLVDHLIIAERYYFSFADEGLL